MTAIARLDLESPISRKALWGGRIASGLPVLFLLFDGAMKLVRPSFVIEGTRQLGYPESTIVPLGVVLLTCVVLYLIPRTAVLGALLLTGYLGGAIASHVRQSAPLLSHSLFPIYVAALLWLGLWLRDQTLRSLLPIRRRAY